MKKHLLLFIMLCNFAISEEMTSIERELVKQEILEKNREEQNQEHYVKLSSGKVVFSHPSTDSLIRFHRKWIEYNCTDTLRSSCADMEFTLSKLILTKCRRDYEIVVRRGNSTSSSNITPTKIDLNPAIKALNDFIKKYHPHEILIDAQLLIASLYGEEGDFELEKRYYNRIVSTYPHSYKISTAHFHLARIYCNENSLDLTSQHLSQINQHHISDHLREEVHLINADRSYRLQMHDSTALAYLEYLEKCKRLEYLQRSSTELAFERIQESISHLDTNVVTNQKIVSRFDKLTDKKVDQ